MTKHIGSIALVMSGSAQNINLQNIVKSMSSVIIRFIYRIETVNHTIMIITGATVIRLKKSLFKMYFASIFNVDRVFTKQKYYRILAFLT